MHEKLRSRILGLWAETVTRHPRWVLLLSMFFVGLSVLITVVGLRLGPMQVGPLTFQSDRNDLLSKDIPWNQAFIQYHEQFPGHGEFTVVVDAFGADGVQQQGESEKIQAFVDELGERLRSKPEIGRVTWRFNESDIHPRAIRMLPMESFDQRMDDMSQVSLMLESENLNGLFQKVATLARNAIFSALGGSGGSDDNATNEDLPGLLGQFDALLGIIELGLSMEDPSVDKLVAASNEKLSLVGYYYLQSDNGRFFFIRVQPTMNENAINAPQQAIEQVRMVIAQVNETNPDMSLGVTGVDVIEADETGAAMRDSAQASVIAFVLIGIVLVIAFHSWRVPILALITLLVAIAWSFGFLTIAVGHLQVLSVVFTVILLGLGIDYGIHLASRYELLRHDYQDTTDGFIQTMVRTFKSVGPGLITGAVTTAAAFAMVTLNDFKGLTEMGLIAAAGVMLCLLAMFTVFPALLRIYKRRHRHVVAMEDRAFHFFEDHWVIWFANRPMRTLFMVALITAAAGYGMSRVHFDYNLMNLLPRNVESVQWQDRVVHEGNQQIWYGVSLADSLEEVEELAGKYRDPKYDTIADVGGVARMFPTDLAEKMEKAAALRSALEPSLSQAAVQPESFAPAVDSDGEQLLNQLKGLQPVARMFQSQVPDDLKPTMQAFSARLDRITTLADELPADDRAARFRMINETYRRIRHETSSVIDGALDSLPLQVDDFPDFVRRRYVSHEGTYVIEVIPNLPEGIDNPLDPRFLGRFVKQMEQVDPDVTGSTAQIYRSGELIWDSFLKAGLYAMVAVFVLVWFDFQRISDSLLSLVPVVIGFVWMFGLMHVIGQDINPANIMVLPLLFGIGVDAGVHMLHRYRRAPDQRPLGLTAGTGKGITMTSMTTMIGFASMIPSSHRGIQSLGIVLTIGIAMTLLACWIVLPAWLELLERRRGGRRKSMEDDLESSAEFERSKLDVQSVK